MRFHAAVVVLCVSVVTGYSVIKMAGKEVTSEAEERDRLLYTFLMARPFHTFKRPGLSSFSFTNCGDPKQEALVISKLVLSPDPLPTKGTITVTLNGNITRAFDAPLKASVKIEKEVFGVWIKVPCVDNFGSCDYADFCKILGNGKCPDPFVQNKVPCHCPFPAGNFSLPGISLDADLSILPPGGYKGQIDLSNNNGTVGCYAVEFSVS